MRRTKKFPAATFFESFFTAGSCENDSKKGAAGKLFGPSYFVTALVDRPSVTILLLNDVIYEWSFACAHQIGPLVTRIKYVPIVFPHFSSVYSVPLRTTQWNSKCQNLFEKAITVLVILLHTPVKSSKMALGEVGLSKADSSLSKQVM